MDLVELLNTRGIEYKKTNNPAEILISCTSGEHTDKSPSLSYNLEKNIFHCWSCGFSGGINKFMKSRYNVRAPIIAFFPEISIVSEAEYIFLIFCVS